MTSPTPWTTDDIATLRALRAVGLSGSAIAERMGRTRSAVIGKMSRLGIPVPATRIQLPRKPREPKMQLPQFIKTIFGPRLPPVPPQPLPPNPVTLFELEAGMCRYPVNDVGPFLFCGAPQIKDCSYCGEHKRLAYVPGSGRKVA
jgi:GcrA cell cycle regulator